MPRIVGKVFMPLAMLLAIVAISSCGGTEDPTATPRPTLAPIATPTAVPTPTLIPAEPKEVVFLWTGDLADKIPWGATGASEDEFNPHVFGHLWWPDVDMLVVNHMVDSWEWVDNVTVDITLHDNIEDHSGDPFTASDVAWNYNEKFMIADESRFRGRLAGQFGENSSMEVMGDYDVRFHNEKANVVFTNQMGIFTHMITEASFTKAGGLDGFAKNPVGPGPYKFVEHLLKQRLVVEAFDDYFLGRVQIDKVTFQPVPDYSTRLALMQTQRAHVMTEPDPADIPGIEVNPDIRIEVSRPVPIRWIHIQEEHPIFKDKRVRQALNYGVDKQEIADVIWGGFAYPARAMDSAALPVANDRIAPYPYDPAKATQLLTEAGYADGFKMKLEGTSTDKKYLELIQFQLGKLGIDVEVKLHDPTGFFIRTIKEPVPEFTDTVTGGCNNSAVERFLCSSLWLHPAGRGKLYTHSTVEMGNQIDAIQSERDTAKRMELIHDFEVDLHERATKIYMVEIARLFAVNNKITYFPTGVVGQARQAERMRMD